MGLLHDMFAVFVETKVVENIGNEITFVNFISQAKKANIMKKKDKCIESFSFFGNSENDTYLTLYDYLVKKQIITSKYSVSTFFTASPQYNVNEKNANVNFITNAFKNKDEIPSSLQCYTINYSALSVLLKTYKNNVFGGGKTRRKKQYK